MLDTIKDIFKKKQKPSNVNHFEEEKTERRDIGTVATVEENFSYSRTNHWSNREALMTSNMDKIIDVVKNSIVDFPFLARTILNITNKASKQDFYFEGDDKEKVMKVAIAFNEIVKASNYSSELFLKDCFNNFVKYSNLFIIPIRDEKKQILRIRVIQNKGWTVFKKIGTSFCEEFILKQDPTDTESGLKKYKNKIEVLHYTFNKESDEIFALPIWCSVIDSLKKYHTLIENSLVSYKDQSIIRTIYEIGFAKNGQKMNVTPETYNQIKALLEYTDDDLITETPINANIIKKTFTSPDKLFETLENQIVAGLFTSKNQLGISSAGRQDSEVQDENTKLIAESFSSILQHSLNQTIIKEICKKLFGDHLGPNEIKLKFYEDFNVEERIEKHAVFLFQGGIIDLPEARRLCKKFKDLDKNKTFFELYKGSEMDGNVENVNNPKNQHVPGGTGTTKKTKKDRR